MGRFVKGVSASPSTQFKKGEHWRTPQAFRESKWLVENYINKNRSTGDIAKEFNVTDGAIIFWLKKHNIKRRTISDARGVKLWGQSGEKNPMFGKCKNLNKNWKGGITPERQAFYLSEQWKKSCSIVWKRDNATCQLCKNSQNELSCKLNVHHIKSFAVKELRSDPNNLVLLCRSCHSFVHSKKNTTHEFIQ